MRTRRRRGLVLLAVALVSGGLAASRVQERERSLSEQVGPAVEVAVASRDIQAGARLRRVAVAVRRVPARYVPPDALASADGVVGARLAASVSAGGYLTAGAFEGGSGAARSEAGIRQGERAVTIEVAGGAALEGLVPRTPVDVLVSMETVTGGGRTLVALAGAELIRMSPSRGGWQDPDAASPAPAGPAALATLRVSLRQAVYLTAADNFAREIRLLSRPPGDRSRAGAEVASGDL